METEPKILYLAKQILVDKSHEQAVINSRKSEYMFFHEPLLVNL